MEIDGTGSGRPSGLREVAPPAAGTSLRAYAQAEMTEREILSRQLAEAHDQRGKALAWLVMVGVGPAAILAIVLSLVFEGSREAAVALALLGAGVLAVRAYRAHRKIEDLEASLEDPMDGS